MYEDIKNYAEKYAVPIMRKETSEIISKLIEKNQPDNILEIGTAIGYSGIVMLSKCDAKLVTLEHNKNYIKQARRNFKNYHLSKRVKIIDGDCLVTLVNLANNKKFQGYFDVIFLDGPKAQYLNMLELLILLLNTNGLLIVDDVLFHKNLNSCGKVARRFKTIENRLNLFIQKLQNHNKIKSFELKDIEDGIIIATKG